MAGRGLWDGAGRGPSLALGHQRLEKNWSRCGRTVRVRPLRLSRARCSGRPLPAQSSRRRSVGARAFHGPLEPVHLGQETKRIREVDLPILVTDFDDHAGVGLVYATYKMK